VLVVSVCVFVVFDVAVVLLFSGVVVTMLPLF